MPRYFTEAITRSSSGSSPPPCAWVTPGQRTASAAKRSAALAVRRFNRAGLPGSLVDGTEPLERAHDVLAQDEHEQGPHEHQTDLLKVHVRASRDRLAPQALQH